MKLMLVLCYCRACENRYFRQLRFCLNDVHANKTADKMTDDDDLY